MNLKQIKDEVAEAREAAIKEAQEVCGRRGYLKSRGTFIATAGNGCQCGPYPAAEALAWTGTLKEIEKLAARVMANHPDVEEITITGGYDWAESLRAYLDSEYDPWVSAWEVVVWKRPVAEQVAA